MADPQLYSPPGLLTFEDIAAALAENSWGIFTSALPHALTVKLHERALALDAYEQAGIGRQQDHQLNTFVRRDEVAWINGDDPAERDWLNWVDGLRLHLNRSLMLGLTAFESHFAHYQPGAFYRKHLDAFRGESNRVVSMVLYLNPDWTPADGGELVLFDAADQPLGRFPPTLGTLAVFLSEEVPHEVLPTSRDRFSLTGWLRCRAELPLGNL